MKKRIASIVISICFIGGCSSDNITIEESKNGSNQSMIQGTLDMNQIHSLKIADYFPLVGLKRSYLQYGTTGVNETFSNEVIQEEYQIADNRFYLYEVSDGVGESLKEYVVTENDIRLLYVQNEIINKDVNELILTNEGNWLVGDEDHTSSAITKLNLKIKTNAGIFTNVIEVTNTSTTKNGESITVHYYAPSIGLIKTAYIIEGELFIASELESSNIEQIVKNTNPNEPGAYMTDRVFSDSIHYRDEKYGIEFTAPFDITNKIIRTYNPWAGIDVINFDYKDGDIEQPLFGIIIEDVVIEESEWTNPYRYYLGHNNQYTFVLAVAPEASESLLNANDEQLLQYIQQIVNDVEQIIPTFKVN